MTGKGGVLNDLRGIRRLIVMLCAACVVLVGLGLLIDRARDDMLGLYGSLGVAACVILVLIARGLRKALERIDGSHFNFGG